MEFTEETQLAIQEVEEIKNGNVESKVYSNVEELFKDLGI